jgi:arylsulfatase B/arylsulfatase I/J
MPMVAERPEQLRMFFSSLWLHALLWTAVDGSSAEHLESGATQPPNIVFMLIDDYGHTDIGYHNQKYDNLLRTPHLDTLAATGIKLEGYYVQPVCTPTRSQLMTGMYQIHTGLQHGVIHPQQPYGLPTSIPLMSNRLIERGYVAHKVGKVRNTISTLARI